MHQKPRIPPRPKEDGVSCCMMDEKKIDPDNISACSVFESMCL